MAKNKNRSGKVQPAEKTSRSIFSVISARGWKTIAGGAAVAALGFIVLSFTDPAGRNWASNLCPFLILGGYAIMGTGILLPGKNESDSQSAPPVSQTPVKF